MVDNFDLIRSHLKFENPGDCYYVQLLRRQADDPMIDGKKDPTYHGNMHSRSIKDYFISSLEHFDRVKDEIKTLCNIFNVRAYIRMNKRNYKQISLELIKHVTDEIYAGETYASPFHLISSAAGKSCCAGKEKTWIIDIDKEYLPYEKNIVDFICMSQPYQTKEDMWTVPTKSGKHIICKPFNMQALNELWCTLSLDMPLCDIHKDNPTILYVPESLNLRKETKNDE